MVDSTVQLGTDDLEKGLRPSAVGDVARIGAIAILVLLVFDSAAVALWARDLPSSRASVFVAERVIAWNDLMWKIGPAKVTSWITRSLNPTLDR